MNNVEQLLQLPSNLLDKYSTQNYSLNEIAAIENVYPDLIKLKFDLLF